MRKLLLRIISNPEQYLQDGIENEETIICNEQLFCLKTLCSYSSSAEDMCFSINVYAPDNAPMQYSGCHLGSMHFKKEGGKPTFISNAFNSLGVAIYDTRFQDPTFDHEGTLRSEVNFVKSVNALNSDMAEQTFELKDRVSEMMETTFKKMYK